MTRPSHIMRRRLVLSACLIVWAGALIATHLPADRLPMAGVSDKLLHAAGYFVISGLFWLTLRVHGVAAGKRIALVFFTMLAYAAIDEITQPLVGRDNSLGDWFADITGMIIALTLLELLTLARSWSPRRKK